MGFGKTNQDCFASMQLVCKHLTFNQIWLHYFTLGITLEQQFDRQMRKLIVQEDKVFVKINQPVLINKVPKYELTSNLFKIVQIVRGGPA